MKKLILVLISFCIIVVSANASAGDSDVEESQGWVVFYTDGISFMIALPVPGDPLSPYTIDPQSKSISITADNSNNAKNIRVVGQKSTNCVMTEASLAAQNPTYTAVNITRLYNSYLTILNSFSNPGQSILVRYSNGVCTHIQNF